MAKKGATGDFYFIFAKNKNNNLKMDNIFSWGKKKWKNCGRPTGFNFCHPLDRKQIFSLDSLRVAWLLGPCVPYLEGVAGVVVDGEETSLDGNHGAHTSRDRSPHARPDAETIRTLSSIHV